MFIKESRLKVKPKLKLVINMMKKLKIRKKDICHLNSMLSSVKVVKL